MTDRDIIEVIARIKDHIPESEVWESMKQRLEEISESSKFRAPEVMHLSWSNLCEELGDRLGEPDTEWKQKIGRIIRGE